MAVHEKKDNPENAKGDKGHEREHVEKGQEDHTPGQPNSAPRGGHRKRTGGNPDASND